MSRVTSCKHVVTAVAVFAITTPQLLLADEIATAITVEPQALASALKDFSDQTGLQIAYVATLADNKSSPGTQGAATPTAALDELLHGTDLEHQFVNEETVAIGSASVLGIDEGQEPGKSQPASSQVLMAQNQTSAQDQTNMNGTTDRKGENEVPPELEEIVVTGTHIRGIDNVGAATITFTREEIQQTGFSTVEELFESLPQNLDEFSADGARANGASSSAAANSSGVSGISLRGLGASSTLVLLNGKRRPGSINGRVVDVSAIPLSMIERVEVVSGGRSAIYGSDAVAGVVNIVTRTEFDGAETQVYYGEASAGAERFNFSQTFGKTFDRGGFVLGYDYRKDEPLDATDAGAVADVFPNGSFPVPGFYELQFESEQHVGLFAGHFELSDKVELYADAQFSSDTNDVFGSVTFIGCCDSGSLVVADSDQYSAVGGVRFDVGKEWQIDFSGLFGIVDNTNRGARPFIFRPERLTSSDFVPTTQNDDEAKLTSFSAIADGPLGEFAGGTISAAIGVDYRKESYENVRTDLPTGTSVTAEDRDRDILSVFGEVHLPLINRNDQRLEVSLAGRYDDYSDFGDTFNPQFGVEWEPISGLIFRGSYAEAFRAPDLFLLAFETQTILLTIVDPLDPTGMTTVTQFGELGGNPDLQPEEADTWTVGIDWKPSETTTISLSYFNIEYADRIELPISNIFIALQNESFIPGFINRTPTSDQLATLLNRGTLRNFTNPFVPFDPATDDPLTVFPDAIIVDSRRHNIALDQVDGLDFQASTVLETNSGDWSFGLNGTYYLDFERNVTATSPTISQLNQPGKPVDLRLRGSVGWSRSAWNVNAYLNYVDSYDDTFATTPTEIDSWTTVDLTFRFDASEVTNSGFLDGFVVTLAINNALDEDPPAFLNHDQGLRYDATNADAIGRFVSLRLSKSW